MAGICFTKLEIFQKLVLVDSKSSKTRFIDDAVFIEIQTGTMNQHTLILHFVILVIENMIVLKIY